MSGSPTGTGRPASSLAFPSGGASATSGPSPAPPPPALSVAPETAQPPRRPLSGGSPQPLRYGCRVLLYRQSLDGYVVATSSAEAPVGLQRDDPAAEGEQRLNFEQTIFIVAPGDPVDAGTGGRGAGDVVKYGQLVRLVHQTRQQPLCHHTEQHAVGLKGNLRVLLAGGRAAASSSTGAGGSGGSGGAGVGVGSGVGGSGGDPVPALSHGHGGPLRSDRWRIMPRYRLRVEGEAVADGDPVLLQSPDGARMINSAEQFDEMSDGCFLEVSCGAVVQGFQMQLFDPDVGPAFRPSVLRCGDCITLLHTEEHKYVTADLERMTCYLRSPESKLAELGDETELAPSLATTLLAASATSLPSAVPGASPAAAAATGRDSRGGSVALRSNKADTEEISYLSTFFVEGADPRHGGALRSGTVELYRLKCLSSGLYLKTGCTVVDPADCEIDDAALAVGEGTAVLNDGRSVLSSKVSQGASSSLTGFSIPQNTMYAMTLTSSALDAGTVFRIRLASSGAGDYVKDGNRVFLEAADTPSGSSLWLVAGGRLGTDDAASEVTVASLAAHATSLGSVALYARAVKSMRDGVELRRLPASAARELQMVRGLLPPLERYAVSMLDGVGDPFRVREVRENMNQLQQLCHQRTGLTAAQKTAGLSPARTGTAGGPRGGGGGGGGVDGEAGAIDGGCLDDGGAELLDTRDRVDAFLNPMWQTKLFQQGVPSLVLRVAEATVRCPHVRRAMLYTADMVQRTDLGDDSLSSDDDADGSDGMGGPFSPNSPAGAGGSGSGAGAKRPLPPVSSSAVTPSQPVGLPRTRGRRHFVPMRYSDLGYLVDTCFDFVALLVNDRPKYAESLHPHVDFIVECCTHMPSALRCLAVLFRNNPVFVELPMAKARLDFFLGLLSRGRDPNVLRIIQLFAQCGEDSMVEAQRVILEFFCVAENASRLLCPIRMMPPPADMELPPIADDVHLRFFDTTATAGNPLAPLALCRRPSSPTSPASPGSPIARAAAAAAKARKPRFPSRSGAGEIVMVGLPHSVFAEEQSGDSLSIATSAQYRGRDNALGRLLLTASNAEDLSELTFFPIEGLKEVEHDWPEVKDTFIPYYTEQLLVFASLAAGRNHRACKELIFQWVPRDILLLMMRTDALPTAVHAAFVALFARAMVDVGGSLNIRQEIRNIRCVITGTAGRDGQPADRSAVSAYTFRVDSSDAAPAHTAALRAALPDARRYVTRFLAGVRLSGDEEATDEYLATLHLTEVLVNGGAFATEEYDHLIMQLANALDPGTDDSSTHLESPPVHLCKCRALRLLNSVMDIILTRKALELVDCFRTHASAPPPTQLFQFTFDAFRQRTDIAPDDPAVRQPVIQSEGLPVAERPIDQPLVLIGRLCESLMRVASATASMRVRRQCIFLFLRVTNYLEELHHVANRVQLLTSEASIGFYTDINNTSASIEFVLRKSFRRSNTHVLAHEALDDLDRFLSVADYGAAVEKFAMMRHVGIPQQLVEMLERLPLPIRESGHRIIFKVVSLLQTMAQDELIHEELRRVVEPLAPLATQDGNIISLLRTLYVQGASERCVVPFPVIAGVTQCLYTTHSAGAAIDFLVDLLSIPTVSGHPITQHQQLVWRGIVCNSEAVRHVQFRHSWCGDRGRRIREKVLSSRDYYMSTDRLSRHIGLCHLLYLVSLSNELVLPEEIRHEVFGLNSVDAMLEVTTDPRLPAFFRKPYIALTETLVLDDAAALAAIFSHHSFGDFIRLCAADCARLLHLLGGSSFFPEVDEELERREDAALRCPPVNAYERSIDDARFGRGVYEGLVFGPAIGCLLRVCRHFKVGVERLSNRLRSQLKLCINEMVDMLCDLAKHSFELQEKALVRLGEEDDSAAAAAELVWSVAEDNRLCDVLLAAAKSDFFGTSRWRGDAFAGLCEKLERRARVACNGAEGPGSPILAPFSLTAGDDKGGNRLVGASWSSSSLPPKRPRCEFPAPSPLADKAPLVAIECVDLVEPATSPALSDSGSEQALTSLWVAFLERCVLHSQHAAARNVYITAAGIILRTGDRGSSFLRTLFCTLATMSGPNTIRLLYLARQVACLTTNNPLDDSVLIPFVGVTTDAPCLTIELSRTARQSLLARWPGDLSLELPVPLLALVTELAGAEYPGVRLAVLEAANTLLHGGHRGMQESYNRYCKRITDERLFFILRNHLSNFIDALRRFHQAIMRGSSPDEAAHFLADMPTSTLELQMIQLLCANQFSPLQGYLAAQPDNDVSVNLIESLVELLSMSPMVANEVTTGFFLQLLLTISETLQGPCQVNQDCFVAYSAADYLTLLLSDISVQIRPKVTLTSFEEEAHRDKMGLHRKAGREKRKGEMEAAAAARAAGEKENTAAPARTKTKTGKDKRTHRRDGKNLNDAPSIAEIRRHCMNRIHTASLSTLLALIEGRQDPEFIARVLATVDLTVLGQSMDESVHAYEALHGSVDRMPSRGFLAGNFSASFRVLRRYFNDLKTGDHRTNREELQDELALAVSIYTFFRACYDMQQLAITHSLRSGDGKARLIMQSFDEFFDKRGRSIRQVLRKTESYQRMAHRVAKVEIVRDGTLERVYFRILSSSEAHLYGKTRDAVILDTVRTSDNERIQSFFAQSASIMVQFNTLAGMRRNLVAYMVNYCQAELSLLALLLILVMNLTMVIGIRAPTSPYEPGTPPGVDKALHGIGIAIVCIQGTLLVQALIGPARIMYATNSESWQARREERVTIAARHNIAVDRSDLLNEDERNLPAQNKFFMMMYTVITCPAVIEHAFFLYVCIMGFLHHRIWYSVQLLQILFNSPVLRNLLTALTRNLSSLTLTLILLIFVIFVFTTISFYFFAELLDPLGLRGNGFNCFSLSQCFLVHIDNMRSSGGIGDSLDWPTFFSANNKGYWFTFYRFTYYLFICLILQNLFLGVIVDSLAEIRQEHQFIMRDQESKCFICGIERNVFDVVQPGTYNTHISEEHNMWHYIFFLHYLSAKDPADFTGQEAYVSRLVRMRDVTMYPIGRSMVLSSLSEDSSGGGGGSGRGAGTRGVPCSPAQQAAAGVDAAAAAAAAAAEHAVHKALEPLQRQLAESHAMLERLLAATRPARSSGSTTTAGPDDDDDDRGGGSSTGHRHREMSRGTVTFMDPALDA